MTLVLCNVVVECREKVLDREYLCMYVVVVVCLQLWSSLELSQQESIFLPKKSIQPNAFRNVVLFI